MATARTSCPDCGDVELTTEDVTVRVCLDDNRGEYRFTCPRCRTTVVKSAEHRTIDLLVASGAHMDTWTLPAELSERPSGAELQICHDDILNLHSQLQDDAAVAAAVAALDDA